MSDPAALVTSHLEAPKLGVVLDDVGRFLRRYVVFAHDAQVIAVALWVAHAHAIEAADVTAYLEITSPAKRSGKTRLLELLELLIPRPLRTGNISDAALFRIIDEARPTILLDEADAIFGPKSDREDLRALLNAGYRRGAEVVRCEANGRAQLVRRFDAFAAKAIAAIGTLPDTISDRSVQIRMQRRAPGELVERFRFREASAAAEPIRVALAAWAATEGVIERLRAARPDLPHEINDRAQDGWEPLLAIADAAAGDWPKAARVAAVVLHGADGQAERAVQLLHDMHAIFEAGSSDRLSSAAIVALLNADEESPWGGWPLDQRGLARLLRPYGVKPRVVRLPDGTTARGYHCDDFRDLWLRYLPPGSVTSATSVTPQVGPTSGVTDVTLVTDFRGVEESGSKACPECGFWPHHGGHSAECSQFVRRDLA